MINNLSNNLLALMEHSNISAMNLARLTGIPLSTLKNIRKSTNINPTIETLIPLANYFSVSIDELIAGKVSLLIKNDAKVISILKWDSNAEKLVENPANMSCIYTEKSFSDKSFGFKNTNDIGSFISPGIFLIDPELEPNHMDYVLVYKKTVKHAFVRQFIIDGEFQCLKSIAFTNKLTVLDDTYGLLGVIFEYRQQLVGTDKTIVLSQKNIIREAV